MSYGISSLRSPFPANRRGIGSGSRPSGFLRGLKAVFGGGAVGGVLLAVCHVPLTSLPPSIADCREVGGNLLVVSAATGRHIENIAPGSITRKDESCFYSLPGGGNRFVVQLRP